MAAETGLTQVRIQYTVTQRIIPDSFAMPPYIYNVTDSALRSNIHMVYSFRFMLNNSSYKSLMLVQNQGDPEKCYRRSTTMIFLQSLWVPDFITQMKPLFKTAGYSLEEICLLYLAGSATM